MDRYEIEIEVLDAAFPASRWLDVYGAVVFESAVATGALEVDWHRHGWGVVLSVAFRDEESFELFQSIPAVRAALDAVPDPVRGLVFHRGWGGTSGSGEPRRPRPMSGAGSASVPVPPFPTITRAVADPV